MQEPSKNHLRIALRRQRQNLPPDLVREDSARIRDHLLSLDSFREAKSVMLYLPARGEVDTWPLLDHFWTQGSEILLPRCCENAPGIMEAYAVASREDLGPGCFGLVEPQAMRARKVPTPEPEVILVPALAFDRRGYRLGFGGGYYDRFLPTLACSPLLIGPAYAFQILKSIPVEPWDRPVELLITPDALLHVPME
ncbi:MAG: 5-formyltetrahydrofolate cyclo-ligase [Desulfomicrobium sp.]|nr:5-formyltetrahydrofolate cyclo-ligase [Pseudomonadota bacterium]MBV1711045.1 5-formyltetrahydrofolate cyclo-ligase [Desulfomicrobium sp.]MBU4570699.1 5-formyltetrahydrofolate cyclo-ligase [Pseudomonadota bacterium]MBU4593463.1 5-formyltetrahydrofolate cyclo-ligase [Pseudomonadota bacterium]MBV1719223.1 5-formyltetrahydrofolate cyclo-ligase [Desulfomicrobium sp.]